MRSRRTAIVILLAVVAALAVPLAAMRYTPQARGQVTPPGTSPTTPQPTVPCTPPGSPSGNPGGAGCGKSGGTIRNLAYAWIERFCNGSAVPTPPGQTTFALNYALGGQATEAAAFTGTVAVNGVIVPSAPLFTLQPGQKDTRIRTAVIDNNDEFVVTLHATGVPSGAPVFFANGSTTRIRMASGACPGAPPQGTTPSGTVPVITNGPVPLAPNPTPGTFVPNPHTPLGTLPPGTLSPTR